MAECIVNFLLGKLSDFVVQEVLRLYGVDKQVEIVSRELSRIQAFLKDADKKQIIDERQKYWVKEVRDLAYSIEDVIDTFLTEVSQEPQKSIGMMEYIKRMIKKARKLTPVDKLVDEISQIRTRMEEIEASRLRYGINNLGEGSGEIQLPIRPFVLPDIDPEVIGFNKEQDHIVKELLNETTKKLCVVSIWGAGGLGKTTIAQKVYNNNNVKKRFGLRIWVVISQKFQLIEILRKIMEQLNPSSKHPTDEGAFLTKIYESLKGKNYLIVFDDVWTVDLWTQIGVALPDEKNGSRVLVTTRSFDVAKDADPACEPYKLEYLTNESSFELLVKKALPNQVPNNRDFDDLSDIMHQFVHKCGGLPLALVIVGGLLSKKPCNYTAWSKVLKTMSWNDDGNKCSEIIGTSYEDLPFVLKSCFMYFGAYPEDHEIDAKQLIRMWVAEGFISQESNRTLEETAESFLEDLVKRSMVLVKSRFADGSINYCYIHDLLRDLAVRKAEEDKFLVVYSHPDDQRSLSGARRVAVHHLDCHELVMSQNLRTLLYFGNRKYMPNCSKQRLLKVVSTEKNEEIEIKLDMFEGLNQLRYLSLKGQSRDDKCEECLEKMIGSMKFLQTVILWIDYRNKFARVPECVWHMNTLRHVYATLPVEVPPSTKLTNLQTLPRVIIKESWETELPHLPNLRSLHLEQLSSSWGAAIAFLGTLEHLTSLHITGSHIPLDIFDMRGFPFYQHLQSLTLDDVRHEQPLNEVAIDVGMFPLHLTYLLINNFRLNQDVLLVLEKLPCLKELTLEKAFTDRKMCFSAKSFSQLEVLNLCTFTLLENWEIEEGAMPILRELKIRHCSQLCVPQGLRHLTNLQKFMWRESGRREGTDENDDEIFNLLRGVVSSTVEMYVF